MKAKGIKSWYIASQKHDRTMLDIPEHSKCLFCDGHEGHYIGITETMHVKLKGDLLIAVGVTNSDLWQIKYCPMCGRRLNDGKA